MIVEDNQGKDDTGDDEDDDQGAEVDFSDVDTDYDDEDDDGSKVQVSFNAFCLITTMFVHFLHTLT